jgi:hypothetical protein
MRTSSLATCSARASPRVQVLEHITEGHISGHAPLFRLQLTLFSHIHEFINTWCLTVPHLKQDVRYV